MKVNRRRLKVIMPSSRKSKNRVKCLKCFQFVNKKVVDCQPCAGSVPSYSMLHKFSDNL